ncbi:hypothetical protein GCM10028832_24390 [Streptomyces sparsus]
MLELAFTTASALALTVRTFEVSFRVMRPMSADGSIRMLAVNRLPGLPTGAGRTRRRSTRPGSPGSRHYRL